MSHQCESQRPRRMNSTVTLSKFKLRWLPRFGLRTLLILVALFGAGFGYLGHLYRRVSHQRQIVAKIEEAGGDVRYNWQLGQWSGTSFKPVQTKKPPGPALIRLALGDDVFAYVEYVDFLSSSYPAQPFDPKLLGELPRLRSLWLVGPQACDEWLNCVAKFPQLKVLVLFGVPQSTPITDAGLAAIARSPQLENLSLGRARITDDGLLQLSALTNLKTLSLGPDVSKQSAQKLQESLPHCRIDGQDQDGPFVLPPH